MDDPSQITGQYGEARSANEYADSGADVKVEPGEGIYDLELSGEQEYIEVKTREVGKEVTYLWASKQISLMNSNYEKAIKNGLDIQNSDRILELRAKMDSSQQEEVKSIVQTAVDDSENLHMDEIRIKTDSGDVETVPVSS